MLDDFEKQKREEMTAIWRDHFEEYKDGFEMFTSKLYEDAPALIIGFNPGGELESDEMTRSRMQQFASGDFSRPEQVRDGKHNHPDYLPDYASGSNQPHNVKKIFKENQSVLKRTVETNRFYMRTSGKSQHKRFLEGLSEEAFEEYMSFCRETTHETIKKTRPDVILDFANQHYGRATEFCADLGFDSEPVEYHQYTGNGPKESISVATMIEPPHATVVSVRPHLSAAISNETIDEFSEVIQPYLNNE